MLNHGGKLNVVAQQFAIKVEDWLDLSTGVSPFSYPVPEIPEAVWRELPQLDLELTEQAKRYYGAKQLLALAGSQAGIQLLPAYRLRLGFDAARVWLPKQGYKEHEKAWRELGFTICHYQNLTQLTDLSNSDVVVVINPNNPTGELTSKPTLLALLQRLNELDGWLVVDEAFLDVSGSQESMLTEIDNPSVFILRSMGKFFGLAGMRIGFLAGAQQHLSVLHSVLGPWHVNGPACFVATKALADTGWQTQQKVKLEQAAIELSNVLESVFSCPVQGTNLFKTLYVTQAESIYIELCEQGVYVRLSDEKDALRFGIPTQTQLTRLTQALTSLSCTR